MMNLEQTLKEMVLACFNPLCGHLNDYFEANEVAIQTAL